MRLGVSEGLGEVVLAWLDPRVRRLAWHAREVATLIVGEVFVGVRVDPGVVRGRVVHLQVERTLFIAVSQEIERLLGDSSREVRP